MKNVVFVNDQIVEKYNNYKKAIEVQQYYRNNFTKTDKSVKCSNCGRTIKFNGCTPHNIICPNIYYDKLETIKKMFNFYQKSIFSGQQLNYYQILNKSQRIDAMYIVVKNAKEYSQIKKFVYAYETHRRRCIICNRQFIHLTAITCCEECYSNRISNTTKMWHQNCDIDVKKQINRKIGIKSSIYHKGVSPWNKGMSGEQYMSYYIKNGKNTFYEALAKNTGWFKKTKPQMKFEQILNKHDIKYKYNICIKQNQYDFLTFFGDIFIVFQIDGDYWHKSQRRCNDQQIRKIKRMEDKLKQNVIHTIKNTKKKWYFIRIWQLDLLQNIQKFQNYVLNIKENINSPIQMFSIITQLKELYNKNA